MANGHFTNELLNFTRSSKGWYWNKDGLLAEAAVDEMRFEYDPATGDKLGLLIEESRTNQILDSRDMTTGNWSTSTTVTRDKIGIDGQGNTACLVEDDATGDAESCDQTITVADDSNTYAYSLFIKKDSDTSRYPQIQARFLGGTIVEHGILLNTSTGAIESNVGGTDGSASVEDFGDWWRVIITLQNNGTGNTSFLARLRPAVSDTGSGFDSSITGSLIVDQAQVEPNASFPTSPIITGGATVTRSADVATVTDLSWYNESEGAFLVEFDLLTDDPGSANAFTVFEISDGTTSNRLRLRKRTSTELDFLMTIDGNNVLDINGSMGTGPSVAAMGYISSDQAMAVDGQISGSGTESEIPTSMSTLLVGISQTPNRDLNGHIKSLAYYPERLSDAQLKAKTS